MNSPDIEIIPPMPKSNSPKSYGRQYGIYNHVEDRWQHDRGNVFVFSNHAIAAAQCLQEWIRWYDRRPVYRDGKEIDLVMEVIEFIDDVDD